MMDCRSNGINQFQEQLSPHANNNNQAASESWRPWSMNAMPNHAFMQYYQPSSMVIPLSMPMENNLNIQHLTAPIFMNASYPASSPMPAVIVINHPGSNVENQWSLQHSMKDISPDLITRSLDRLEKIRSKNRRNQAKLRVKVKAKAVADRQNLENMRLEILRLDEEITTYRMKLSKYEPMNDSSL